MIEEGLVALLKTSSPLVAIVGSNIFFGDAPPDLADYPCVAYKGVGGSSDSTFKTSGVTRQRIEIDGMSFKSPGQAALIASIVYNLVDGWEQVLGDGTTVINTVTLNPGTDFVTEQRMFRRIVEFYVDYTQPAS